MRPRNSWDFRILLFFWIGFYYLRTKKGLDFYKSLKNWQEGRGISPLVWITLFGKVLLKREPGNWWEFFWLFNKGGRTTLVWRPFLNPRQGLEAPEELTFFWLG